MQTESTPGPVVTYFIQAASGGPIKIGKTCRNLVAQRLAQLQTGNPELLVVRHVEPGDWEADHHWTFRDARLVGEWFAPTPDLCRLARCKPSEEALADAIKDAYMAGFRAATETQSESRIEAVAWAAVQTKKVLASVEEMTAHDAEDREDFIRNAGREHLLDYQRRTRAQTTHADHTRNPEPPVTATLAA